MRPCGGAAAGVAGLPDYGTTGLRGRRGAKRQAANWDDTGEPVYNIPVALGLMVFFALCAQCAATLAVIKRETNSWRWPLFAFVYMTVLAYVGAQAVFISIRLIGGNTVNWFGVFFTLSLVILAGVFGGVLGSVLQARGFVPSSRRTPD